MISSESHVYDDASRMTSKTVDSVVTNYTYDDISQLTGESRTGYVCTYSYDANGNRLTKTLNDVTENYTYDDADKMLTAGSKSYTYDDAGRTTSVTSNNQTTTLSYDYESRLTQITYPNSTTNTFTYNALDTRVGKVDSGGTKAFKRDGVGVTAPVLSDGSAAYTPGVAERRGGTSKFYHGDYLNSITRETDSAQATTATKQYDAFGMPLSASGSSASPFGFAGCFGYQEDDDSGLKLLGHRYYDPSTGRFLTRDPAKDGRNWYGYCENDPSGAIDPSGKGWIKGTKQPNAPRGFWDYVEKRLAEAAAKNDCAKGMNPIEHDGHDPDDDGPGGGGGRPAQRHFHALDGKGNKKPFHYSFRSYRPVTKESPRKNSLETPTAIGPVEATDPWGTVEYGRAICITIAIVAIVCIAALVVLGPPGAAAAGAVTLEVIEGGAAATETTKAGVAAAAVLAA